MDLNDNVKHKIYARSRIKNWLFLSLWKEKKSVRAVSFFLKTY